MSVSVQFAGCGDAFGSGGRFQACIVARWEHGCILLDCGASSLIALKRADVDIAAVDAIVVSHLHGDHFGGIPFLLLALRFGRRRRPLTIAGPAGTQARVEATLELLYPGALTVPLGFEVRWIEVSPAEPPVDIIGAVKVEVFEAVHASGAPALALRLAVGEQVIGYTGDTGWCAAVPAVAWNADLLIAQAYGWDRPIRFHLSVAELMEHKQALLARRIVLVHLGEEALRHCSGAGFEVAEDGLRLELSGPSETLE